MTTTAICLGNISKAEWTDHSHSVKGSRACSTLLCGCTTVHPNGILMTDIRHLCFFGIINNVMANKLVYKFYILFSVFLSVY